MHRPSPVIQTKQYHNSARKMSENPPNQPFLYYRDLDWPNLVNFIGPSYNHTTNQNTPYMAVNLARQVGSVITKRF